MNKFQILKEQKILTQIQEGISELYQNDRVIDNSTSKIEPLEQQLETLSDSEEKSRLLTLITMIKESDIITEPLVLNTEEISEQPNIPQKVNPQKRTRRKKKELTKPWTFTMKPSTREKLDMLTELFGADSASSFLSERIDEEFENQRLHLKE